MEDGAVTERELSVDEALQLAIHMLRIGESDEAGRICALLRRLEPNHPDVLHYSGVLAHHQGRGDEAIALIQRSLELLPEQADCYSNLGLIYHANRRVDDAIAAYQRAIVLNPSHVNAYNNLGVLLRATGKPVESEAAYRKALEIDPEFIDAYHNLGVLLASVKRTQEAVICYCKVTTLAPRHRETRRMLGLAYCVLGQRDKAIELYEEWLKEEPDHPVVALLLAGCTGRDVPSRASDECVQNHLRWFRGELRIEAGAPALPRARTGARDARGLGSAADQESGRARCGVRHRVVRSAGCAICTTPDRRRPLRRHARASGGQGNL